MPTITRNLLALGLIGLAVTPLRAQHRSDVLTSDEIVAASGNGASAYDAVQSVRPQWLKAHNTYLHGTLSSPVRSEGAHVYVNDVDQGDVEYLKTIPAGQVAELRFLSASEAGARFGPTEGPAIVVALKR